MLSELGGALLLFAFVRLAVVAARPGALFALALVAVSPVMVDFSANGSPYVWSALALFLASEWLRDPARLGLGSFAAAGALAGLAPMLHGSLLAVPVALVVGGLVCRAHLSGAKVIVFLTSALVVVAPYAAWSYQNFGSPFYSYSPLILWANLGLAEEGIWDGVVTWRWVPEGWTTAITPLLAALGSNGRGLPEVWLRDSGPVVLLLAIIGVVQAVRASPSSALRRSLPALFYLALISPLLFRDRFAVPILPIIFLAAGAGFSRLDSLSGRSVGTRHGVGGGVVFLDGFRTLLGCRIVSLLRSDFFAAHELSSHASDSPAFPKPSARTYSGLQPQSRRRHRGRLPSWSSLDPGTSKRQSIQGTLR